MTFENSVFQTLKAHAERLSSTTTAKLFTQDSGRFEKHSHELDGLFIDFSKNCIDDAALAGLIELARSCDVEGWRARMFAGEPINTSENRSVLHVALRDPDGKPLSVEGTDIRAEVRTGHDRMATLVERLRSGKWLGATQKPISDVIHIGIGGSVLGPAAATRALTPTQAPNQALKGENTPRLHFVTNVDATSLCTVIKGLDPEMTLVVVVSKTFTTQETMTNARSARDWLLSGIPADGLDKHLLAVSAAPDKAAEFGVHRDNVLAFWNWVGGRFSLWSAVGFPIALVAGMEGFKAMLDGARRLDEHFASAPLERNIPVLFALIGVWNTNFLDIPTHAVLPYDDRLAGLPAHLQQLEMESNGKGVHRDGTTVYHDTAPVVFGLAGTDAQHTVFQLLHQGTRAVSTDFIGCLGDDYARPEHHDQLMANLFAQTEALMLGRVEGDDGVDANRACPGNRPSTTILLDALTPQTLGMLLALYEHKVFVQGVLWGVNAFDQWGVELGKQLGKVVLGEIATAQPVDGHDGSTNGLINRYLKRR